jgi:hypothetical protein
MSGIIQTLIGSYAAPASGGGGGGGGGAMVEFSGTTPTAWSTSNYIGPSSCFSWITTTNTNDTLDCKGNATRPACTSVQTITVGSAAFCVEVTAICPLNQNKKGYFGLIDMSPALAKIPVNAGFFGHYWYNGLCYFAGVSNYLGNFSGGTAFLSDGDKIGYTVELNGDMYGWQNGVKYGLMGTIPTGTVVGVVVGVNYYKTTYNLRPQFSPPAFNSSGTYT